MTSVTVPAYAKINLTLDVLGKRPDGYHDIRSIMQTVALHDTLEVTHTPDVPGVALTIQGAEAAGVPNDESNIVHRAAVRVQKIAAAREILPGNRSGLHIALTKRIPSQAGLGGGSSDAAAALKALTSLFRLDLPSVRLSEIAASLGADVPFFLTGGTALVEGLGETVTPLPPFGQDTGVVIAKPPCGVATAGAYAMLDGAPKRIPGNKTNDWGKPRWHEQPLPLGNDFQDVVLGAYPQIAAAIKALSSGMSQGQGPLLCGSGSAVFVLVPGQNEAIQLADTLSDAGIGKIWVTKIQGREE